MVTTARLWPWAVLGSWLLCLVAIVLSLRMIGQPVLEMRFGPDLVVSAVKTDGWRNAQQPGDAILAVDGRTVVTAADIGRVIAASGPGGRHVVDVQRGERRVSLHVQSYRMTFRNWLSNNLAILLYGLAGIVAATMVILRRARGPASDAFAGMALCMGLYAVLGVEYLTSRVLWPIAVFLQPANALGLVAFGLALRHPGRRWRWPWLLTVGLGAAVLSVYPPHGLAGAADAARFAWHLTLETTVQGGMGLLGIIGFWVLGFQAWRHSERFSVHRQQVAIILAGAILSLLPLCGVWLITLIRGQQPYEPVAALALVTVGLMPLNTAAALLRVRLVELERFVRLTLIYSLTAGGLGGVYIGLYTGLSTLGRDPQAISAASQFALLLVMVVLLEPLARRAGRRLDRFLYGDRWAVTEMLSRIQRYGASTWSLAALLTQIARDVGDAAQLQTVAVAIPDGDGWRIAAGHGEPMGVGVRLAAPLPDLSACWAADGIELAGYRAAIPLILADRPIALLLLGNRRDGVPLSAIDLRYVSLFRAPLGGMIGYVQSQERQRQTETAIAGLHEQIGHVNLAVLNQSAKAWGDDDLMVPLRLIVAQAGLLLDGTFGELEAVQQRRVALIHRQARRLGQAIADTDELQALLSGTALTATEPVDLQVVVQRAWSQVQPLAEHKAVRLVTGDGGGPSLRSDASRLGRVIEHLLDNAVTHSPAGAEVSCRWTVDGAHLTLTITDTGPGIPAAHQHVLQAFATALQDRDSHRQGRMGIGLALVQATVSHLGGTVQIETGATGTAVSVVLPLV
jgi:signal transduction histidine kinase